MNEGAVWRLESLVIKLGCRVTRDVIFCQVILWFCRRTLSVKTHPGLWAMVSPLQLPNGLFFFFFCLHFCRMYFKDKMGKVSQYISVGRKEKVVEIFDTLSPVLLSI